MKNSHLLIDRTCLSLLKVTRALIEATTRLSRCNGSRSLGSNAAILSKVRLNLKRDGESKFETNCCLIEHMLRLAGGTFVTGWVHQVRISLSLSLSQCLMLPTLLGTCSSTHCCTTKRLTWSAIPSSCLHTASLLLALLFIWVSNISFISISPSLLLISASLSGGLRSPHIAFQ